MKEKDIKVSRGPVVLIFDLLLLAAGIGIFIYGIIDTSSSDSSLLGIISIVLGSVIFVLWIIITCGFFIIQPNEAVALVFFGEYRGTVKTAGWHWANPFLSKKKISLRSRNLNGEKLKVNDEMGNPIEIAVVVVWKVENTAEALFEVENYVDFVKIQSESALRHLAGQYPYDDEDNHNLSLRGNHKEVIDTLTNELQERLKKAGVVIEEARISHLAYAPEIAAVMLQRQQAAAIIAARQKIVEGAVGMVEMALSKLNENKVLELDEAQKAAMVSNLLVVLCGEKAVQPTINAGTSYNERN